MKRVIRPVVWFLAALGGVVTVVTLTPLVDWWARLLAGEWQEPKGQVLLVLCGDHLGEGLLGVSSYWRSVYAVKLWRQERYERVVISGDSETAPAMKGFLVFGGIPEAAVALETRSGTTRESAFHLAAMLAGDRRTKVLLTSDYHVYRAWRALRKAGVATTPYGLPDVRKRMNQRPERLGLVWVLGRETAAVVYYKFRGWI